MALRPITQNARSAKKERLEARIPQPVKDLLQRAADLCGLSLSDFVISSAERAAKEAIREHNVITLTARDSLVFAEALLNPREPNEKLRAAVAEYLEDTVCLS